MNEKNQQSTDLQLAEQAIVQHNGSIDYMNPAIFDQAQRYAKLLSSSSLVPKHFQNNIPNCMIAINMSARTGADVLSVMQNMYIVHGNPSFSSKYILGLIISSNRFKTIDYEFEGKGDAMGCRLVAVRWGGEKIEGPRVDIAMAKAEGWMDKNGSKWKTMPEVMLRYRAISFFANVYCPDLSQGMPTHEEMQDVHGDTSISPPKKMPFAVLKQAPATMQEEMEVEYQSLKSELNEANSVDQRASQLSLDLNKG